MRNVVNADAETGATAAAETGPVDFAFLAKQTFDDADLAREVLGLFVEQARRTVPRLPLLVAAEQRDAAHLLKGSARGIGAWDCAAVAETYEVAEPRARATIHDAVATAFGEACAAIEAHLISRPTA